MTCLFQHPQEPDQGVRRGHGCPPHRIAQVGRSPWTAADALVGLLLTRKENK